MCSHPTPSSKRTTTMSSGSWPLIRIAEAGSSTSQVTICSYRSRTACGGWRVVAHFHGTRPLTPLLRAMPQELAASRELL
ncbi:hypothetical protein NDU88_007504 [Pleurodeles waltl]|uniref:Uncharacterized protein n=1 Tax=Pleurodeles waltl TaxID=8319 RepID=A0AAV7NT90_PLEWA|nr:hypothetical protein NDU88_007504 [Pleurodeles waltl]